MKAAFWLLCLAAVVFSPALGNFGPLPLVLGIAAILVTAPPLWSWTAKSRGVKWWGRSRLLVGVTCLLTALAIEGERLSATPEFKAQMAAEEERKALATAAERARQQRIADVEEQAAANERRKGMHCLNNWDGSHWKMQEAVKSSLRNPSSFEHVQTAITPVDSNGRHQIIMDFRAENGFGGMNVERAIGVVSTASCKLEEWEMV